jgi:hypothetical protein
MRFSSPAVASLWPSAEKARPTTGPMWPASIWRRILGVSYPRCPGWQGERTTNDVADCSPPRRAVLASGTGDRAIERCLFLHWSCSLLRGSGGLKGACAHAGLHCARPWLSLAPGPQHLVVFRLPTAIFCDQKMIYNDRNFCTLTVGSRERRPQLAKQAIAGLDHASQVLTPSQAGACRSRYAVE